MRGDDKNLLIAIVDDEAALREATQSLLRSVGFVAECFASAEDFLRSGCGERARCILLDVCLPGMSGLELQRYLAAIDFHIPIVFMSAQDDPRGAMEAQALGAGASAFLRKPFLGRDLLGAVQTGLLTYTKGQ